MYNKKNPKVLNDFLKYLIIFKNYSKLTVEEYRKDLILFFEFLIEFLNLEIKLKDITIFILSTIGEKDILAFLVYLNACKNNSPKTRNRKLASIKSFFKYLYIKYPYINDNLNPAKNIKNAEVAERLPKYLKLEEARKLQNIFNESNSQSPLRNNLIIVLFLNTGLRISELRNINIEDISLNDKTIRVIGKGNRERIVYLNERVINMLEKYLSFRQNPAFGALFVNNQGKRLSISRLEVICKRAFMLAGLNKFAYTSHSLRHSFATYMYRQTKDILVVKKLLGHTSISSTAIYTHIENSNIRNAVNRNPLSYEMNREETSIEKES